MRCVECCSGRELGGQVSPPEAVETLQCEAPGPPLLEAATSQGLLLPSLFELPGNQFSLAVPGFFSYQGFGGALVCFQVFSH